MNPLLLKPSTEQTAQVVLCGKPVGDRSAYEFFQKEGRKEPVSYTHLKYVFVNCWSYQNRILKIDTETDKVVDQLTVGIQPTSLVLDKNNKMWTITDGGYEGSPYGYEAPSLYRIDAETFQVEKQFKFKLGDWPSEVQLNREGDMLYWINKDIWQMSVDADRVPRCV